MSDEEKALVPIEVRQVDFYGDELTAVLVGEDEREQVYVPIRPICDFLGLSWGSQRNRINRDPVLAEVAMSVFITNTDIDPTSRRPHTSTMLCLPLKYLNGWLFGVNAARVRKELSERVIRYQKECYEVLANAFMERAGAAGVEMSPTMVSLAQIKEMALAIAQMADQQMEFERRMAANEDRLDRALKRTAVVFGEMGQRLTTLEKKLAPGNAITDEQAAEIQAAVHGLGMMLTEQDKSKNQFQGIFNELHRRFGVTSYKLIPQGKYAAVLAFLQEWRERAGR